MSDTELETILYPYKHKPTKDRATLQESVWLGIWPRTVLPPEAWEAYIRQEPGCCELSAVLPSSARLIRRFMRQGLTIETTCPRRDHGKRRCGEKPDLVYDPKTETFQKAHFFVTSIGFRRSCSSKPTPTRNKPLGSTAIPVLWNTTAHAPVVHDNTKTARQDSESLRP